MSPQGYPKLPSSSEFLVFYRKKYSRKLFPADRGMPAKAWSEWGVPSEGRLSMGIKGFREQEPGWAPEAGDRRRGQVS